MNVLKFLLVGVCALGFIGNADAMRWCCGKKSVSIKEPRSVPQQKSGLQIESGPQPLNTSDLEASLPNSSIGEGSLGDSPTKYVSGGVENASLGAARKSFMEVEHVIQSSHFSPGDKAIYMFLLEFVRDTYFPVIVPAQLTSWKDIYGEAKGRFAEVEKFFNEHKNYFIQGLAFKHVQPESDLEDRFDNISLIFFKALYDAFSKRGYAINYLVWLQIAAPFYSHQLKEAYPELPQLAASISMVHGELSRFTGSVVNGLSDLVGE